jgi:N-acetyl-anhydromuramyl-L-alanine amidase AmpD
VSGIQTHNPSAAQTSRGRRWFWFVGSCGLFSALTLGFSDDRVPWMISRKVAEGLSVSRTQAVPEVTWSAETPESVWQYLVIHHSGTREGNVQSIHREHRQRKDADGNPWLGIAYHFVIGNGSGMSDGAVEATFRWKEQLHGAHAGNSWINAKGIGICLIGNFEKEPPTKLQLRALEQLVTTLATRHRIPRKRLIGHSSVRSTACPGRLFPLERFRQLLPEG